MRGATIEVSAYIDGHCIVVEQTGRAESGKEAKRQAYRACLSELKKRAEGRRYIIISVRRVEMVG